jgi:peptide/nickel transport system substrate-binding protein
MQVTETLVEAADDGRLQPGLATSWVANDGAREWRFTIATGVRFHDGSSVTSASIVACLRRAMKSPGALAVAPVHAIEADGKEVVIRLREAFGPMPSLLSHASTQILAPASFDDQGKVHAVIGTGPYRVSSIEQPQDVTVEAFDGWRGHLPVIHRIHYLSVSRAETRALLAESGQADLVFNLDPAGIARLRGNPRLTLVSRTLPRTISLKVNSSGCLSDARTRLAISLAMQRSGIARGILRDPEMAATQLFPPVMQAWHDPRLAPLSTDIPRARQLLRDAGWSPARDGMLEWRGQCSPLDLRSFPDRPELPVIAAVVQENLRQIGLRVRVRIGNSGDVPGGHHDGTLQLALMARNYANFPDPAGAIAADFGPQGGDWGAMNWSNAELVERVAALLRQPERDAAESRRVADILQRELPIIPIAWYRQTVVAGERVRGVSLDPFERSYRLTEMQWKVSPVAAAVRP